MIRLLFLTAPGALVFFLLLQPARSQTPGNKALIAHRGASAYAPEHTLAAYALAMEQGADFVEQDLAVSKDGVLVCIHDLTLERTTNVEEVFPHRFVTETSGSTPGRRWLVNDFTLAELKRLDAGSWFDRKFAGARIPTFQEAIDLVRGRAGLYPELKDPEFYRELGVSPERLFAEAL
ncbi:MAG: glycerophosphodiester phosphodiesterase family protein, partial [Acidimicrobiia bacterium]